MSLQHEAIDKAKGKMEKTISALVSELSSIRAGRANPQLLNRVMVDYYGTMTPIPQVIRLLFPEPTEERRKELVKMARKKAEDSKVAIRSLRRDANEALKKDKKASNITEDDLKELEKDCQDMTDSYIKKIEDLLKEKENEIMEV